MIKHLIKLANHLDKKGLTKEADYLDKIIQKAARPISRFPKDDFLIILDDYNECINEQWGSEGQYDKNNDDECFEKAFGKISENFNIGGTIITREKRENVLKTLEGDDRYNEISQFFAKMDAHQPAKAPPPSPPMTTKKKKEVGYSTEKSVDETFSRSKNQSQLAPQP